MEIHRFLYKSDKAGHINFIAYILAFIALVAGIVHMPWTEFFLASFLARGLRFGAGAFLGHRYGDKVQRLCQKSLLFRKKHTLSQKLLES